MVAETPRSSLHNITNFQFRYLIPCIHWFEEQKKDSWKVFFLCYTEPDDSAKDISIATKVNKLRYNLKSNALANEKLRIVMSSPTLLNFGKINHSNWDGVT